MDEKRLLARITTNPEIFSGKPIVRGMRISVELILSLLAQGQTSEDILIDACAGFAPDREPRVKHSTCKVFGAGVSKEVS